MTYVSHTVRSLRRDPIPGETVRLVLTLDEDEAAEDDDETAEDDATTDAVAEAVESLGGGVVRELPFGRLLVEVTQTELDAICELDGVSAVETDAVIDHS